MRSKLIRDHRSGVRDTAPRLSRASDPQRPARGDLSEGVRAAIRSVDGETLGSSCGSAVRHGRTTRPRLFSRPETHGLLPAILVLFFGCLFFAPATAQAQLPLGFAGAQSDCHTSGDLNEYRGIVPGRYPCKAKSEHGNTRVFARGSSRATFGFQTGFARVQGSARAVFNGVGTPSNAYAEVILDASVAYSLQLPLVSIPPPGYVGQPLPVTVSGNVSGLDSGNTSYGATVTSRALARRMAGRATPSGWRTSPFSPRSTSM